MFTRIEGTAASNSVITQACAEGKKLCDESIQFLRIADTEGFDVAMAFSKGPVVSTEDQGKRSADARASVRRSYGYGYSAKPYNRPLNDIPAVAVVRI